MEYGSVKRKQTGGGEKGGEDGRRLEEEEDVEQVESFTCIPLQKLA